MNSIFTEEERKVLERYGTKLTYHSGHIIYFAGDPADRLYYIISGRVRVYYSNPSGKEMNFDVVKAGHILGESVFEKGSSRPVNAQAVNTVKLVSYKLSELEYIFDKNPTIGFKILKQCSVTMNRLCLRLVEQGTLDRFGKIASFILDTTETDSRHKGTEGGKIPYTHEELAAAMGLNRSTVSTVLKHFEEKGWIEKCYRHFVIKDREALIEFVNSQKNK